MSAPGGLERRLADIAGGTLTPAASIASFEERVDALDGAIRAFVRRAGPAVVQRAAETAGPLAGIPIGVKDIFDTADMATEYGSAIYAGHQPRADAALVALARRQGAFIAGKLATTEFAHMTPTVTRNPRDLARTPGGSSSGSAAAVAAGMVACAFGTQTAGSIIRPASFCGVAGYKPSFRLLPTVGTKCLAWSLDTAGLFASSVSDAALVADLVTGRPLRISGEPGSAVRVGLYRSALDGLVHPEMHAAVEEAGRILEAAGARLLDVAEPAALTAARDAQAILQSYESAQALVHEQLVNPDRLSPGLAVALTDGAAIAPQTYDAARRTARDGRRAASLLFEAFDVLIAPSALGPAPATIETTGDPAMNRLWSVTGNPCVNVPGFETIEGLPLGITVVARFGRDRELLAIADRLERLIASRRGAMSTEKR